MSSNLFNKALKNIKIKDNLNKINCSENEINENLKKSFEFELKNLTKTIQLQKLFPNQLYEFLIKYENNLPPQFYYKYTMELGDILLRNGYPSIARNQCYERYLINVHHLDVFNTQLDVLRAHLSSLDQPDETESIVSAIFGLCQAEFRCIKILDNRFQAQTHQQKCHLLLTICCRIMELILKREEFCWLIYNGSVCIYWICEALIRCNCSLMVVEPLMWASCCLETSIPLLTISNLKWRSVIYTATCQALFNIQHDADAEAFARRALVKINELHEVYEMSSDGRSTDNAIIFSEALIKMGVMIFKRNAFETRRRPKTYLRPKTKVNFKEILQNNWPRTGTERILAEMFESPSQQILAILEAVKQPSKTIGKIEAPAAENEWEMLDVYSELFYAAIAIITGRSTSTGKSDKGLLKEYRIVDADENTNQLMLGILNGSTVTIESTFELVCWAFSYGNWKFLDVILDPLLAAIKDSKYLKDKSSFENTLNLLRLMRKCFHASVFVEKKVVKLPDQQLTEDDRKQGDTQMNSRAPQRSVSSVSKETRSSKSKKDNPTVEDEEKNNQSQDSLCQLSNLLEALIAGDFDVGNYFQEILVEAGIILWNKCKPIFQTTQDGSLSTDSSKPIPHIGKWIRILNTAHRILSLAEYSVVNPVSYAEISIRLGILLEQLSINNWFHSSHAEDGNCEEFSLETFISELKSEGTSKSVKCISAAKEVLKTSIRQLDKFRNLQNFTKENLPDKMAININSLDDLYLEMNSIHLRIRAREIVIHLYIIGDELKKMSEIRQTKFYQEAIKFCNKNLLLLAIFQAHLGSLLKNNLTSEDTQELVNHIKCLVEKSESNLSDVKLNRKENSDKMPAPIIETKGSDYITVKLDTNIPPEMKSKIGWIRLYGRAVDTPNAEVRLTDDKLPGTGIETACLSAQFTVHNLAVNEQYILAFSIYDKFGSPIGRGIGKSTKYILAIDRINPITAISIITQALYEMSLKEEVIFYENLLWPQFIEPIPECMETYQKSVLPRSCWHKEHKIKMAVLNNSSPMLLRNFCLSVLSSIDCECQLLNITNDINVKSHSQIGDQINRLKMVDKLLVMFCISKKLKDSLLTMEVYATIAYLMVPIMNHNQFIKPYFDALVTSVNVLAGLPQTTWIKIPAPLKNHIHHLSSCVGFYLLKCLNKHPFYGDLSETVRQSIALLLQMSGNAPFTVTEQEDGATLSGTASQIDVKSEKSQLNTQKKLTVKVNKGENAAANFSPQQIAFESFKFTLAKQGVVDHQLSGNEEPDILMAYITLLPSRHAYKEVSKFARKNRYFQFIVEVLHKAVIEGNLDYSLSYYREIKEWLKKRNEAILGRSLIMLQSQINRETIQTKSQNPGLTSDNNMFSRSVRTDEDVEDLKRPPKQKKKAKYKAINVLPSMSETQKQMQEQAELKALDVLSTTFVTMYKQNLKRRRFRQLSEYERASRIKMNCSMAMGYISIGHAKVDSLAQILNGGFRFSEVPEIEDITKFMLESTGKILPLEKMPIPDQIGTVLKMTKQQNTRPTDTPRTYRSDINVSEKRLFTEAPKLLSQLSDAINKAAVLLRRAIVFASRGKAWLLLVKACSLSWYTLSLFINTTRRLWKFLNAAKNDYPEVDWSQIQPVSLNSIFKLYSSVFFFGSESILDMIEVCGKSNLHKLSKDFDEAFMENFILKSIHLLFETGSYEKSVHVILRFTLMTNYLFVNVTHPILIESQQLLCGKARENQARNPDWTEQICQKYVNDCMTKMKVDHLDSSNYQQFLNKTKSGYFGRKKLFQNKSRILHPVQQMNGEGSHANNLLNILKSEASSILLFSVPVSHEISRQEWSTYQNERSIKKEWMELYYNKNYFYYFHNSDCVTAENVHKITLQELLTSYKEFLDNSLSNNDLNHYSFALNDMGDLYINQLHKPSLALSAWKGSLDCLLNQKQSVKNISQIIGITDKDLVKSQFQMEKLLSKFGAIKCLLIGRLLTKISRLDDLTCDERINLCLHAAIFFKAIYSGSFAHPEDDMNYLDHSLFLDSTNPTPLVPKVNIFSNPSVVSIQEVESQLYFLIKFLVKTGYYQSSVCLVSLYEHIVYTICRSPTKCIQAQLIKLEVCIKLRRFSTASRLIFQLFTGDKVPQLADSRPAPTVTKTPSIAFDDQKQLTDEKNLLVLDKIISRRIIPSLAQKVGPTVATKISLLQAMFLVELSSCVPVSPEVLDSSVYASSVPVVVSSKKQTTKKSEPVGIQTEEESHSILDSLASNLQYSTWKEISLPILKGLMLHAAGSIVQPIIEDFTLSIQREDFVYLKLDLYEVDNVFFGLLLQARNCRLRLCNRSGARLAMFAGRLLKEYFDESISFDTKSARLFEHLDIFSHMKWNQELISCLLGEVSVENSLDISETAISDIPPVKELIISCIGECDSNDLSQYKAWFLSALAQYSLISGYEVEKYKAILSESVEILNSNTWLSDDSEHILIESQLRGINLQISSTDKPDLSTIEAAENSLRKLHDRVMNTIDGKYLQSVMWNVTEPDLSSVQIPNVYEARLNYLCKIKLLFGIIIMEKSRFFTEKHELRMKALAILNVGLDICRSASRREPWVETEYLLIIGRIQRLLLSSGKVSQLSAISTFLEGLKLSVLSSGHLGVKKQFYLELAITFMISSHLVGDSLQRDGEIANGAKLLVNAQAAQKLQNQKVPKSEALSYKRLSWLAIKCATSISDSIQNLNHFKSDTSKLLSQEAQDNFPISLLFDLYGRFKLGNKRIIFKNEIEEELSRMPECKVLKDNENLDEQIERIRIHTSRTSLSQVLVYHELLMKLTNNTFLSKSDRVESRVKPLTRCIFNEDQFFEKEEEINKFLFRYVSEYRGKCIPPMPKDIAVLSSSDTLEGMEELILGYVNEGIWNAGIAEKEDLNTQQFVKLFSEYPKGVLLSNEVPERIPLEKSEVNDTEIFLNFYDSPFEFSLELESKTMVIYAESKKVPKSVNNLESMLSGWLLIPSRDILPVYQDFQESAQLLEILANNPEATTTSRSSEGVKKPPSSSTSNNPINLKQLKANSQILPLSVGSEISVIEFKIRQGLDKLSSWAGLTSSTLFTPPIEGLIKNSEHMYTVTSVGLVINPIPFDVSKENVRLLSNSLNPILSKSITNNPQLSKFIQDILKIDF